MDKTVRSRILQEASELFNAKGYRSVTLGELATSLGISKKTLYLYFRGKEDLAEAVLDLTMTQIAAAISEATRQPGAPADIFTATFKAIKQEMLKLNPLFLEDLIKYAPGLWTKVERFRARQLTFIEQLLEKAQQDGVIREVNPRLITLLFTESVQQFVRPDYAAKHGLAITDIADALFMLFIESIRTKERS